MEAQNSSIWVDGVDLIPGSVVLYRFGPKKVGPGRLPKTRPVVVLCTDTHGTLGVPLTSKHGMGGVRLSNGKSWAIPDFVTTLLPDNIVRYMGEVPQDECRRIRQSVAARFDKAPTPADPAQFLQPGDVMSFRRKDRPAERLYLIVGNTDDLKPHKPVQTLPALRTGEGKTFEIENELVSLPWIGLAITDKAGTVASDKLQNLRKNIRQRLTGSSI